MMIIPPLFKSHKTKKPLPHNQSGNALFIILIAIALFAALSFSVAQMMSGGQNAEIISKEKAGILSDDITGYARTVRTSIQDMKISNSCEDEDISFQNNIVTGYTNGSNTDCQLFHPNGGGMNWSTAPKEAVTSGDYFFSGNFPVANVPTNGSTEAELLLVLSNLKEPVCTEINRKLGVNSGAGGTPSQEDDSTAFSTKFTGTYGSGNTISEGVTGKRAGCFEDKDTAGLYHFFQVLIPR